jgi:hypothetical protein
MRKRLTKEELQKLREFKKLKLDSKELKDHGR